MMINSLIYFYFFSYFSPFFGDVKTYTRLMWNSLESDRNKHIKKIENIKEYAGSITNVSSNKILSKYK